MTHKEAKVEKAKLIKILNIWPTSGWKVTIKAQDLVIGTHMPLGVGTDYYVIAMRGNITIGKHLRDSYIAHLSYDYMSFSIGGVGKTPKLALDRLMMKMCGLRTRLNKSINVPLMRQR